MIFELQTEGLAFIWKDNHAYIIHLAYIWKDNHAASEYIRKKISREKKSNNE